MKKEKPKSPQAIDGGINPSIEVEKNDNKLNLPSDANHEDKGIEFLIHQHNYATFLRTSSYRRLNLVLVIASVLFVLSASSVSYILDNHANEIGLWILSVLMILTITFIVVFIFRLIMPLSTDSKSLMYPEGIINQFQNGSDYYHFIAQKGDREFKEYLSKEIFAVSRAEEVRKKQLRKILKLILFAYFLLLGIGIYISILKLLTT